MRGGRYLRTMDKNSSAFTTFPGYGGGEGDLVLMSIEAYKYREEMPDLREKLLYAEANRLSGAKTYTIAEVSERLQR